MYNEKFKLVFRESYDLCLLMNTNKTLTVVMPLHALYKTFSGTS